MLQDLTRSAIAVPETFPDPEECSLDNLAALADLAYRTGDLAFAEHCVRRLYALHDHRAVRGRVKRQNRIEVEAA
jgi:hypothetical protein